MSNILITNKADNKQSNTVLIIGHEKTWEKHIKYLQNTDFIRTYSHILNLVESFIKMLHTLFWFFFNAIFTRVSLVPEYFRIL